MALEKKLVRECLERAVAEFITNPLSAQAMRRFATEAPAIFAPVAMSMLLTATEAAGFRYLTMLLVKQPSLFKQLSNPLIFTRREALTLTKHLMNVDTSFDIRFARQLPARNGTTSDTIDGPAAVKALDILDEISPGQRIVPILSHLTKHPDARISAKATLLIGKRVQNLAFATRVLTEETDPRIRANAVESVWGNDSSPVQKLFWECVGDRHNRVVGNGMVGLYLAGDEKVISVVSRLAYDYKAEIRMTSAWTMGRFGNSDFVPTLSPLLKDQHPGVRAAALRSLQNIRQVEKMRRPSETDLAEELPSDVPGEQFSEQPVEQPVEPPDIQLEIRLDGSHHGDRPKRMRRYIEE